MIITGVNFRNRIEVDDSSILADHVKLFEKVRVVNSSIGEYSYIQENTLIANAVIDRFCSIGGDCRIGLVNHPTNYLSTSPVFYDRSQPLPAFLTPTTIYSAVPQKVRIAADVWIGQGVLILEGVSIGVGSVVGAGSVVTRDIEPYSIAAGNPCRVLRSRFDSALVSRLIESKWFELPLWRIEELSGWFDNPEEFLTCLEKD